MDQHRLNFKQNKDKLRMNFKFEMYDLINNKYDKNPLLYEIVDSYINTEINLLTLKRILTQAFNQYNNKEDIYNFVNENLKINPNKEHDEQYHDLEHLQKIVQEFKQIESQSLKMIGNSITISNDINIVKTNNDNQQYNIDNIDIVEMIDIGSNMDDEILEIENKIIEKQNNKINCIFCNQKDILILSETECFCNKCNKKFFVSLKK